MKKLILLLSLLFSFTLFAQKNIVDYVNPNIGGIGHMLEPTIPLVHLPNSMMRISKEPNGYQSEKITHFPFSIVSHRKGIIGKFMISQNPTSNQPKDWESAYDHDQETASPYYYSVLLEESDIKMELTASQHVSYSKFIFSNNAPANLYLQCRNNGEFKISAKNNMLTGFDMISAVDGLDLEHPVKVYFAAKFDQNTSDYGTFDSNGLHYKNNYISGDKNGVFLSFTDTTNALNLKVAISYISTEEAEKHLKSEMPDWDFDRYKESHKQIWNKALSKILVKGGSEDQKTVFYTALYRCYERMVNISENGKYFSNYDQQIHTDNGIDFFVDDWVWDTYRATHPLMCLIDPENQAKKINSYVTMYEQSGWMPSFPLFTGDHTCMNGNHASSIIADAYFKGIRGFNIEKAFEGLKKNELEATMLPWKNGPATELDSFYHDNGFFPALKPGEKEWVKEVHHWEKRQAVALTLGHSYDDWCIARLAKELNKEDDYQLFSKKSNNYKNHYDPEIGFMAPKSSDGEWIRPFDPKLSGGLGGRAYFAENNSWTYTWDIQHDIAGLIHLMGGNKPFNAKLDQLFVEPFGIPKWDYWDIFPDATGLTGQFVMGNEPSLHIPYLYNYSGAPWKTQKRIRSLMEVWFTNSPFGICGDEDGGGLSAFYVFSAMGFYPVTPGVPEYNIGSPIFSEITIDLGNGNQMQILANNCSAKNKYIQSASLNGKELKGPYFRHSEIIDGAKLVLEMGPRPNKTWGTNPKFVPYSMSNTDSF
ncbi:GH92 family glycosyl hydrolase [Labilibaculum antarcticum]|uniref:Alpha-mannosidase n=1 Tax=Labilibaculum antarcticum TaxID=1717717 RepID=A0A1Y1CLV2_9BACT|nr:GH92 family glycosyl hydrolase [Labilibaculum antarcticum]BAX81398.1 hypothetical protein ALGA_3098 [Labilibaculum antarcticum]